MRVLTVSLDEVRQLFVEQAGQFVTACSRLGDLDLLDPSLCRGWSRLDLVVHVRAGLDEMAATAGAHTDRRPTHDAASYWGSHPDDRDDDPVPHVMWLRRTASAYHRPKAAVRHLTDVTRRVGDVISHVRDRPVLFQDKAMTMGDFVATWVVELAVHQMDLDDGGSPVGATLARRTLEAVADADLPPGMSDVDAVLAGLGRRTWPTHVARPEAFPVML
jgi:Mycothiol maleylpyruvate isomerase N-terminal domain